MILTLQAAVTGMILAVVPAAHSQAARADYDQMLAAGHECRYLVCRDEWHLQERMPVVNYVATSCSLEAYLPAIMPVQLPGVPVIRLDLTALGWRSVDWGKCFGLERNPYTILRNPLTVPVDFWITHMTDQTRNDAYLRLPFGKNKPATQDEFYALLGIDQSAQRGLAFGLIEGKSRVNVARLGTRLLRVDDGIHATAWTTYDLREPSAAADPLAALDEDFAHDGAEIFVLMPKTARGVRGVLPMTVLANGEGRLVAEAPVDLVEDKLRTGGLATIRNPMSCIGCHNQGPQRPTENALEALIVAGVQVFADPEAGIRAERFHFSDVDAALDDWQEGYESVLLAINGLTPEENSATYVTAVEDYLSDVTLQSAAAELYCEPETLALALGWASVSKLDIGPRLAGLPHGFAVPRSSWENDYQRAARILKLWNESN